MSKKARRVPSKERRCLCGKTFKPSDPQRTLCIECHLAAKDTERAKAGPTVRKPGKKGAIIGDEFAPREGYRRRGCYDDRLGQGFSMLGADE